MRRSSRQRRSKASRCNDCCRGYVASCSEGFETNHSETLALIAKAFGCDNWNILSAKIEAAERANNLSTLVPVGVLEPTAPQLLRCSFCSKSQHDVRELIVGPPVYICDECVEACLDVIRWERKAFRLLKPDQESGN